jgi:FG-GAP repeat
MVSVRGTPNRPAARRAARLVCRLLAATALAGVAVGLPAASRGATSIPAEHDTLVDGGVISAVVGDVTGDGVRELVRIVAEGGPLAAQVISIGAGGAVQLHPEAALRRSATPADFGILGHTPPDADGMYPVTINDAVRLLVVRVAGGERVLVAAESGLDLAGGPCCMTLWQVGVDPETGATDLHLLSSDLPGATAITVVDLDGDGTDELAITAPLSLRLGGTRAVEVARWQGTTFSADANAWFIPPVGSDLVNIGDTDGLPGDELAMVAIVDVTGASSPATLIRLALDPVTGLREDTADVPFPGAAVGIRGPDGSRVAVASPIEGTVLLDWPAGGAPNVETSSLRSGVPLAVLGAGDAARLLLLRNGQFVDVLDGTLLPRQGLTGSPAAAPFLDSDLEPFVGIVPGGLPAGTDAVVFRGRLARAPDPNAGPAGYLATDVVAVLPGMEPIGVFGPGGGWMGLVDAPIQTAREGGGMVDVAPSGALLSVAPTSEVLTPETERGALQPELTGARLLDGQPARSTIGSAGPFEIAVTAPPTSRVALDTSDPQLAARRRTDESGHLTLNVDAAGPPDGSDFSFSFRLQVATPGGHGYGDVWEVQVLRRPPPLSASAPASSWAFDVPVRGLTRPGVSVTVDGTPVAVAADGRFSATVPAGILPRDVTILATDPVGNEARAIVSVVAVSDYRTWPWIPIVTALTVLAGALLYLRAPRRSGTPPGTLEEIG